jgi:hypothetical protein
MRRLAGLLTVCSGLLGCGSSSKTNVIFYVDPPAMGDMGCIGVAGFDVVVSSGGSNAPSGPIVNTAPVLDASNCHLTRHFTIQDLDIASPATVTVTGYDGAGVPRVEATGRVDSLQGVPPHLQLKSTATPPLPLLVVHRPPLLGTAKLSDVMSLLISTQRRTATLVSVTPGPYFAAEPGAYGVSANLAPGGADSGLALFADVTTAQGLLPRAKLTANWNMIGGYYEAQ